MNNDPYIQRCSDLIAAIGVRDPINLQYEAHFQSNKQVIVFSERQGFGVFDMHYSNQTRFYYGKQFTERIIGGRGYYFACQKTLDAKVVDFLIAQGQGLPIGVIFDSELRKEQFNSLGTITEGEFSQVMAFHSGEIRIYELQEGTFLPEQLVRSKELH